MTELKPGTVGTAEWTVLPSMTADNCGSGLLPVFSTPMLVALMEAAACDAMLSALQAGETSVGVRIDVEHLAASPIGVSVRAEAKVTSADGRRISFEINAFEGDKLIGRASHLRVIVNGERFMSRLG